MNIVLPFVLASCLLGLALLGAAIMHRNGQERRRQQRLSAAFERAKRVAYCGSGEQGQPYSIYGRSAWTD